MKNKIKNGCEDKGINILKGITMKGIKMKIDGNMTPGSLLRINGLSSALPNHITLSSLESSECKSLGKFMSDIYR